jgi:membrane protease YdiL (CAAX protease family)
VLLAVLGLVVAVVASRILGGASFRTATVAWGAASLTWLGYLAVWVPLGAAVAVAVGGGSRAFRGAAGVAAGTTAGPATGVAAGRGARAGAAAGALGLSRWFSWRDLIWGCAAGLLARGLVTVVSVALTGFTGLSPVPTLGGPPDVALLVVMVAAPVVVAPIVEELFFRGLLQGALTSLLAPRAASAPASPAPVAAAAVTPAPDDSAPGAPTSDRLSRWTAAALTAVVFAALHVLVAPTAPFALTLAGTFVLGLFAGGLVATTGRLGGAVVAHVVFNGVAVLLTWPR